MKGQKYSSALILVFLLLHLQLTTYISHWDAAGEGEFQPFVERYLPEKGLLFYVSPKIRTTGDMDISVDIPSTRVESLRLDSWGGYSLGVTGKRITFYSRAVNHGDIPAYNVTASLTVYYWSGVGGIDRGEVVWSERKETYVPPGDGSLSPVITFNWTPEISGSFIINITFELRGDPHPRDNSAYYVGAVYEISGKRRYAGVWVDKWIDSLEGESDIICSPPSSWSKTPFPLGSSSGEYSPPTVFYTGDPSTLISNYNSTKRRLILPPFDLRDVPQDFYDPLYMRKKPQIYLGYKFLGDVRAGGFLRNLISVDGGPYEPLLDPLGNPIIISVNTTDEYGEYNWLCPTHVDLFGYDFYPGIEISRYAGHWVSIAIEYVPGSPDNGSEMGYFLDDFILFMRESYETFSFEVSPVSDEDVLVNPGSVSEVRYLVNFTRVKEVYPFRVYAEASPTPQIHLIVSPEIIREPVVGEGVEVSIFIKVDITTPPGTYSTAVWFVGADETIKRTIDVRVPPFEKLLAEGGGLFHVLPGEEIQILCTLTNGGNVPLNLRSHLQSDMDILAEYPGSVSLTPGERMKLEATITINPTTPGNHTVYWIFYPEDVEGAEGLPPLALYQSLKGEGRAVGLITINIVVREVRDVFVGLLSGEGLVVLKRTPQNVSIPMTVMNRGNTPERLSLSANLRGVEEGAVTTRETFVLLDPGESTEVSIVLSLNSSTLHGGYLADVYVMEEGGEVVWSGVFRLNVLNEKMVKELYDGEHVSLQVIPSELIRGRDAMLVLNATAAHPIVADELIVELTIFLKGGLYAERSWRGPGGNSTILRWVLPFRDTGEVSINLNLTWKVYGRYFWYCVTPLHLKVHNVNIKVVDILFMDRNGKTYESIGNLPPGWYSPVAVIMNTGDTAVKGFRVEFTLETISGERRFYVNVSSLLPDETRMVRSEEIVQYFGENSTIKVRVVVDPDVKLPEGNRQDNMMQRTIYVAGEEEKKPTVLTEYAYRLLALIIILLIVFITIRTVKRVMWEQG